MVVLDTNPVAWGKRKITLEDQSKKNELIDFSSLIDHLLIFLNAFTMLKAGNQVAVIANHIGESYLDFLLLILEKIVLFLSQILKIQLPVY